MRLLSQTRKPEVIFTANDMMALGSFEAARVSNITIARDIALAGFDDIFSSRLLFPRLTTVHVPIMEMGSKAVRYLLKMINGEVDPKAPYREELSTGLVIGGSCGCANVSSQLIS
ncbi:MAG: substrate-binding domain-containing protein [Gammaproteobacteria bacterium]|nr:substrate-binding domain-containing protein [Gammaproteobacteria bacterium]